jgi:hypothetical protein
LFPKVCHIFSELFSKTLFQIFLIFLSISFFGAVAAFRTFSCARLTVGTTRGTRLEIDRTGRNLREPANLAYVN